VTRGHIDEWILFNNAYTKEDSTYCQQLRDNLGDWITIFTEKGTLAVFSANLSRALRFEPRHNHGLRR
jgi:hypothetical protein